MNLQIDFFAINSLKPRREAAERRAQLYYVSLFAQFYKKSEPFRNETAL